jgi:hypothetical protein
MQINAAERSRIKAGVGELAGTGTGNETVNTVPPVPTPVPTPAALQAAADALSQLAGIRGRLELARSGHIIPARARDLKYAFKTRRVKLGGKKRTLTVVKMKESGKQTAYVAQFVEPNWGTACDPAYQ